MFYGVLLVWTGLYSNSLSVLLQPQQLMTHVLNCDYEAVKQFVDMLEKDPGKEIILHVWMYSMCITSSEINPLKRKFRYKRQLVRPRCHSVVNQQRTRQELVIRWP